MSASGASAAEFFLNYSTEGDPGGFDSVSAMLITADTTTMVDGRQGYKILDVTGVKGTGVITGLVPLGPAFHIMATDSYLFMDGGKFFNSNGFAFVDDADHAIDFQVVTDFDILHPDAYSELTRGDSFPYVFQLARRIVVDVQPGRLGSGTPEPSTWALLLVGFAGLGLQLRHRARGARFRPA